MFKVTVSWCQKLVDPMIHKEVLILSHSYDAIKSVCFQTHANDVTYM